MRDSKQQRKKLITFLQFLVENAIRHFKVMISEKKCGLDMVVESFWHIDCDWSHQNGRDFWGRICQKIGALEYLILKHSVEKVGHL